MFFLRQEKEKPKVLSVWEKFERVTVLCLDPGKETDFANSVNCNMTPLISDNLKKYPIGLPQFYVSDGRLTCVIHYEELQKV